jgi:hypothetical protein
VLEAYDLEVSEKIDGHEENVTKRPVDGESDQNNDPFLKMNSNIIKGQTKALVCSVGEFASAFREQEKLGTDEDTKL